MRCPPFASPDGLHTLDIVAQRYGQRPSALLGIADDYQALLWDEAAAIVGLHFEAEALREQGDGGAAPTRERASLRSVGGQVALAGWLPKVPEPDW